MKAHYKRHLISAGLTFLGTFIVTFSLLATADTFTFTKEALISVSLASIIAGVRGMLKVIWELGKDLIETGKKIK